MRMFSTRKPRGFQHTYIYYDERRARLSDIESRAARDLGLAPATRQDAADRLRGAFSAGRNGGRRASAGRRSLTIGRTLALLTLLILLLAAMALLG